MPTSLDDVVQEAMLIREFSPLEGPRDVLVNKQKTKAYIVKNLLGGNLTHIQEGLQALTPLQRCLFLLDQLLPQVARLHQSRCMHRDIKPLNVLVHPERQQLCLADFGGLVRQVQATPGGGSIRYQSPEQRAKDIPVIDQKTDVFSLATLVVEAVCNTFFFSEQHHQELFSDFWTCGANSVLTAVDTHAHFRTVMDTLRFSLNRDMFDLLTAMLHPNPAARVSSADAMRMYASNRPRNPADDAAIATMWQNIPPYTAQSAAHLEDLDTEMQVIAENRDRPQCTDFFSAAKERDVNAMLLAWHSLTPYERDMGPRLNAHHRHTDIKMAVKNGKMLAVAWNLWYNPTNLESSLQVALWNRQYDVARLLVGAGCYTKDSNVHEESTVMSALAAGYTDLAEVLLRAGVTTDPAQLTECLAYACFRKNTRIVPQLIALGADVNDARLQGHDLLYVAAKNGDIAMMQQLLQHPIEVTRPEASHLWVPQEYRNHAGLTATIRGSALVMASIFNAPDIARLLLANRPVLRDWRLLALHHSFAASLPGREAVAQVFAQAYGSALPARLSQGQHAQLELEVLQAWQTQAPRQRANVRTPQVQRSILARQGPLPPLLTGMEDTSRAVFGQGRAAMVAGDFQMARDCFSHGVALEAVRLQRVYTNIGLANDDEAIADCQRLMGSKLEHDALVARSLVHLASKNWMACIADCNRLLVEDSQDQSARRRRCYAYAQRGNETEALADFAQILGVPADKVRMRNGVPSYTPAGSTRPTYLTLA